MNLRDWLPRSRDRQRFFVQEHTREAWHVESDEHCEVMLCGKVISVDSSTARVRRTWGPRKCPECWIILAKERAG